MNAVFFFLLVLLDWSFANGMGKVPYSTCKFIEGESSWPLYSCSCNS